jgi:t-SNARE complex subunit (syntaxin)
VDELNKLQENLKKLEEMVAKLSFLLNEIGSRIEYENRSSDIKRRKVRPTIFRR